MKKENLIPFINLNTQQGKSGTTPFDHKPNYDKLLQDYTDDLNSLLAVITEISNKHGLGKRDVIVDLLYFQFSKDLIECI